MKREPRYGAYRDLISMVVDALKTFARTRKQVIRRTRNISLLNSGPLILLGLLAICPNADAQNRLELQQKVRIFNEAESVRMVNDYPVPVFVSVRVQDFFGAEMPSTYEGRLEPRSNTAIFNVRPLRKNAGWNATWRFNYWIGDPSANPEQPIAGRPPVPQNQLFEVVRGTTQTRFVSSTEFLVSAYRAGTVFNIDDQSAIPEAAVHVYHDDHTWAIYTNLDRATLNVKNGDRVHVGQTLGVSRKHSQSSAYSVVFGVSHLVQDSRTAQFRYRNLSSGFVGVNNNIVSPIEGDKFFWGTSAESVTFDTSSLCFLGSGTDKVPAGRIVGELRASAPVIVKSVRVAGKGSSVNFLSRDTQSAEARELFASPLRSLRLANDGLIVGLDNVELTPSLSLLVAFVDQFGNSASSKVPVQQVKRKKSGGRVYELTLSGSSISYLPKADKERGLSDPSEWLRRHRLLSSYIAPSTPSRILRFNEETELCQ